ncbi:MAG: DUF4062 domain-containing protein [Segetibacter sp.]
MDKKYQVFVSSTYTDLVDERKEVIQALLELDCIPVGMEMFPAADDDQWTLIRRLIDDCDYYILIVGGRYGSLNSDGISYTQMEYNYAASKNIPVISFLHKNPENIATGKSEKDPTKTDKLKTFKELAQKKLCKYWQSPSELGSQVSRSLVRLIKDKPMTGWVKANFVTSEDSAKEILELKNQIDTLNSQIQYNSEHAPKGTENLSQGLDLVNLTYFVTTSSQENSLVVSWEETKYESKQFEVQASWNEIFKEISPLMIDESNESGLKDKLLDLCRLKNQKDEVEGLQKMKYKRQSSSYLDDNSFNQIKVQLRALGLINKSDKKRSIKDSETYWRLTDYGDYLMTRLIAISR